MKKALSLALALMMLISMVCVVPVMAAEPDGSAENPYYVANLMTAPDFITIPANSTVYYQYKAAVFGGWEVGGYGLSAITVDGVVYDTPDMWGEIYAPLNFTFMSPGIVGYVNDTAEDVEVMISHNEPFGSENNPGELVEGVNTLTIPANVFPFYAVYVPMVNGEYTFACEQTEDFSVTIDADGDFTDGVYETLNGSLTLTLESYIPVQVTVSPMGITPDVTITVTAPKQGTEGNPIWLELDTNYTVSAGEDTYFNVDGSWNGNDLIIESVAGAEFTAWVDGLEYASEGGVLSCTLDTNEWLIELILSSAVDNEVVFSMDYAAGAMENPIVLENGDNVLSIPENGMYYYTYSAETDGLLVLSPADTSVFGLLDIYYEDAEGNVYYGYLAEGASSAMLPVSAGVALTISACGAMDEETFINGAVDTTLNVTVKDLLMYNTFEGEDFCGDLEGWSSSSELVLEEIGEESNVANGLYSLELGTNKPYANMYKYVNVEADADYEVTFKAMASEASTLWVKLNDNWVSDVDQADVNIGTEWAEYTVSVNSGACTSLVLLFQHSGENVQTYWFDDILITKSVASEPDTPDVPDTPVVVGQVTNGDFSNGSDGWNLSGSASVVDGALQIDNCTMWAEAAMQDVTVEPGAEYVLSWKSKRISGNGAFMMFLLDENNGNVSTQGQNWMNSQNADWVEHSLKFTAVSDILRIKLSAEVNNPGVILIDDIKLTPAVKPVVGQITNGDFETGDITGWEKWQSTTISADAAYNGSYGAHIKGNGEWGGMLNQTFDVEDGKTYELSFWHKVNSNGFNMQFSGIQTGTSYASTWTQKNEWTRFAQTFTVSGDTQIKINFSGSGNHIAEDAYIDDVMIRELKEPSFDGYIYNGDFECGSLIKWDVFQQTVLSEDAAYSGDYGVNLKGNGGWGAHLEQKITGLVAGETYTLSVWYKANAQGSNMTLKQNGTELFCLDGENKVASYLSATEWTQLTFTFQAVADGEAVLNFCGSGTEVAEDVYVDDILLVQVETPEEEIHYGDANGDGTVNNRDVALLQQYINKWDVTLDEVAADANGDGTVNNRDVALLQQYINKWDVTLGPTK